MKQHISHVHSQELISVIRQEIENSEGHISFARFMELALYTPQLGYYNNEHAKFGKTGDFVTAPEISPLFAECIARQFQEVLKQIESGDILELGAGSGIFVKDVLFALEKLDSLPKHYYILEISPILRSRQKQLLESSCPRFLSRIVWLDTLPAKINGIIFANEVLDAMPVHCFRIDENEIKERCVGWENNQFVWRLTTPSTPQLVEHIKSLQLTLPYESEINLMLPTWMSALAHTLNTGIILFIDYGYGQQEYYHPDRNRGTLTCFYQHQKHNNPLILVGLQDITAHVNFTAVVESAVANHLSLAGFTTQAAFLLACGLSNTAQNEINYIDQYHQSQAIKTLILPGEMGEIIKAMALSKNWERPLLGFALHDRIRDL